MIVDRIEYAAEYEDCLPALRRALLEIECASEWGDPRRFPGGYVMRQSGMTKPEDSSAFETHRKYIDVFILAEGRETVLWNRLENMEAVEDYDPGKDKQPLRGRGAPLEMQPGMFCALFPSDAHSACRHTEGQPAAAYVKYVVKLETSSAQS